MVPVLCKNNYEAEPPRAETPRAAPILEPESAPILDPGIAPRLSKKRGRDTVRSFIFPRSRDLNNIEVYKPPPKEV